MTISIIGNSGAIAEVEANSGALRVVLRPERYGSYAKKLTSGTMAAGLASNAFVYHFRNSSPDVVCLLRRLTLVAGNAGTAFAAGACTFKLLGIRGQTVALGAGNSGTFTGSNAKLQFNMPSPRLATVRYGSGVTAIAGTITISTTAVLASSGTADSDPLAAVTSSVVGTAGEPIIAPVDLINLPPGRTPIICQEWDGVSLQATVPATGTWSFSVAAEWEEVPQWL